LDRRLPCALQVSARALQAGRNASAASECTSGCDAAAACARGALRQPPAAARSHHKHCMNTSCAHTNTHPHMHTHARAHTHTHTHTHTRTHTHTHARTHTHTGRSCRSWHLRA
jgi:hypothetical protein